MYVRYVPEVSAPCGGIRDGLTLVPLPCTSPGPACTQAAARDGLAVRQISAGGAGLSLTALLLTVSTGLITNTKALHLKIVDKRLLKF